MADIHKSATISITEIEPINDELGTLCLICGNSAKCSKMEAEYMRYGHPIIKVCDDCRKAIEWAKKKMQDGEQE